MKKLLIAFAAGSIAAASCSHRPENVADFNNVVPLPREITASDGGDFRLSGSTVIAYPEGDSALASNARLLAGYLDKLTGFSPDTKGLEDGGTELRDAIVLQASLNDSNPEAYSLSVTADRVLIDGATPRGNFYGIQTLRKSIPSAGEQTVVFPSVDIYDYPRFPYRGAHFDVARHFFPLDSVKAFIDMIALHNINTFHWHLSDDQGWRIEIEKYPLLTEVGSVRKGTCIGRDFESSDSIPYGGFYTKEEARELVRYAAERHITVIPEIDLPGHMLAALTAYPSLGCTGGPYDLWQRWGVSEDLLCAGNDSTYTFIADVLGEIMDVFPSEYVHVGGDECPKVRWEACPKCQAAIKRLGIKADSHASAEEKLQSHVMTFAGKVLAGRGRKMIGWDEMLDGGLPAGAAVMSWRGVEGGVAAARAGHDAVMTPVSHCYFDYYQAIDRTNEPLAIGGYVPLEKVYGFEPVAACLNSDEAKHIKGVQANLWTEYIRTFSHVLYMELPRLAALSEVQWCDPQARDYAGFMRRLLQLVHQYDAWGYNYAHHIFDVQASLKPIPERHCFEVSFATVDDAPVHYTLDGTVPTEESPRYTTPVEITGTSVIKAVAVRPSFKSNVFEDSVVFHKAVACDVALANAPHSSYAAKGGGTLTDGKFGPETFNTGAWLGFNGADLVATIDLVDAVEVSSVAVNALVDTPNWIFDATDMEVETSVDGRQFVKAASATFPVAEKELCLISPHRLDFPAVKARYVRVTMGCLRKIPGWHGGAGHPGFLFVDEVVVE